MPIEMLTSHFRFGGGAAGECSLVPRPSRGTRKRAWVRGYNDSLYPGPSAFRVRAWVRGYYHCILGRDQAKVHSTAMETCLDVWAAVPSCRMMVGSVGLGNDIVLFYSQFEQGRKMTWSGKFTTAGLDTVSLQWRGQKCRIGRALQGHAAKGSV